MIEINLLPEELKKKPGLKLALPEIPARKVLFMGFGVFFAAQILLGAFAVYQTFERAHLKNQVEILRSKNREIDRLKSETEFRKKRLREIQSLIGARFYWASLLNSLSDNVIKGVWLRSFSIGEGEEAFVTAKSLQGQKLSPQQRGSKSAPSAQYLKLEGSVVGGGAETAAIGRFIKQLKDDKTFGEVFSGVELSNISQKKIREIDVYDFTLICIFKPEERRR
jgi:Tfp pilus assembly protein PilN